MSKGINHGHGWRWTAWLWAAVVCALIAHVTWLWQTDRLTPNTDLLAMLPDEEQDPMLQHATTQMSHMAQQRLMVLIGAADWEDAKRAAFAYRTVVDAHADIVSMDHHGGASQLERDGLAQYFAYRQVLLTPEQRDALMHQEAGYWTYLAERQIYSPMGGIKIGAWRDDPFGLFAGWAVARSQETMVRPSDGLLRVDAQSRHYVVLPMVVHEQAFSRVAQQAVMPVLHQAEQAARKIVPGSDIVSAGIILHAAAAGQQASHEVSTIGMGSLIGILVLMWITFQSMWPIGMVIVSLGIGCLGALSMCTWLFGQMHVLTLVFGASLIGVAEDYGIHYICARLAEPDRSDPFKLLRHLLPGLTLAMVTTGVAYLGLALTPFPGLREIAVFSTVGLIFAFMTVVCWFPVLDRHPVRSGWMLAWYGRSRARWPRLGCDLGSAVIVCSFVAISVIGIMRLRTNDDIRLLQNSPKHLLDMQMKISTLLAIPTFAHFYVVRGDTEEMVLQREEALTARLEGLVERGVLAGYQAVTNWIPSRQMQRADQHLMQTKLWAPGAALDQLGHRLGEGRDWSAHIVARAALPTETVFTPDTMLGSPMSAPWRHLWLGRVDKEGAHGGYGSVVALVGDTQAALPALQQNVAGLVGVQWVDRVEAVSSLLGRYRHQMGWIVVLSYAAVYVLLLVRYKAAAWRVLAPAVVASVGMLAGYGWIGTALNLFHVLAFMLILGMGVDFGIFLQEHPKPDDQAAWLAIGLSAASTLLSFGLLGLSHTPALGAFGITMLLGVATVWMIAPCFRLKD